MYNDPNQPTQLPYGQGQPPYGQSQPPYAPGPPSYGQPQPPYTPEQPLYGQPQSPYAPPYGVPPGFAQAAQAKKRRVWPWVILGIVVVVVLACGGGIFALVRFLTHSPATDVVNQYYTAIEHQDYATASGYLDPTATLTTQVGIQQQITQNMFIQLGQAADAAEGDVSKYDISSISLNSNNGVNTGDFIVSVTRNGKSYDVHLQLKQEGNDWKIVSLDNI